VRNARGADLSSLHAIVPVRTIGGGKSRLGVALDAEERETLILGMLRRELGVLRDWGGAEQIYVITPDDGLAALARATGAQPVLQSGEGLNEAITEARRLAIARGATAVLILPADLPLVTAEALDRVRDAADAAVAAGSGRAVVVLVPADARGGTNGLMLSPPDVIAPCFGPSSLEQHLRAAAAADASVQVVVDPALAFDLDTPEDLGRVDVQLLHDLTELGAESIAGDKE
jgi:2-phospho-L-lactate/phosphoenolpyruvate guanylyltransferase